HNDTLNCSECHLLEARDIHGVKYLQQNNTYSTSNSSTTVVNCERCHNNATALSITPSRPLVPASSNLNFNHSEDVDNGTRWANASVGGYWNTTNEACEYCHNDTKHDTSAIGLISTIQGTNNRSSNVTSSSTWCIGCHYQAATNYYVAGNYSKIPPTIYYNNTGLSNATDDVNVL
ncbi:MAG: hypothetical protein P1P72_11270, partial [ANME-2 cluster archaeon]|nr:hypothetical protein [ANME-2 cluster archaeon]